MQRVVFGSLIALILSSLTPLVALADTHNGLQVASSRLAMSIKAGQTQTAQVTVTNKTASQMTVDVSVKEFTVNNSTHAISFREPLADWVNAQDTQLILKPNQSQIAGFTISVPKNAAEREYYYALIASTNASDGTTTKILQVASLLYLYVDGGHVQRQNTITHASLPRIVLGTAIPYEFAVANSGNIHLQALTSSTLSGFTGALDSLRSQAIVMPEHSRDVKGAFAGPLVPGLYTVEYGFTDEATGASTINTTKIIYLPLWSLFALIVIILMVTWLWQRRRRNHVRPTAV